LLRILRRGFEAIAEVGTVPPSEQAVLDDTTKRGLKLSPESARNAMEQMDAAEVRAGGNAYWESHYKQFEISSDYVHTSFLGPARFTIVGDTMHIDMNPDPTEGMASLRWGLFYFVRGVDAVLRLVGLDADSKRIVSRYAEIRNLAEAELGKVLHTPAADADEAAKDDG
jgi:hypothetical protein